MHVFIEVTSGLECPPCMCCFHSQILSPAQLAAGSQPVQIVRSVGTNYKFPAPSPYRKPGPQRHGYKQEVFDGGQFSCFRICDPTCDFWSKCSNDVTYENDVKIMHQIIMVLSGFSPAHKNSKKLSCDNVFYK